MNEPGSFINIRCMVDVAAIARALPEVTEGIACAGTKLESRTFQVGKKTFLFVSAKDLRLKLVASADEARRLGFRVGANGWVTAGVDRLPTVAMLRRWIAESHALVADSKAGTSTSKFATAHKRRSAPRRTR
jgi:hypothetical protein